MSNREFHRGAVVSYADDDEDSGCGMATFVLGSWEIDSAHGSRFAAHKLSCECGGDNCDWNVTTHLYPRYVDSSVSILVEEDGLFSWQQAEPTR